MKVDKLKWIAENRQPTWPTSYTNRDTGKQYKPHKDDEAIFVSDDLPRWELLKGGEGCIAAETLINGIPAAEWTGGQVTTLYGQSGATSIFHKGRAGLYRVHLESGREVVVTLDHRFLTPIGWQSLRYLSADMPIASHDNEHVDLSRGKSTNYSNHYSGGFHPCDVLPNPVEVDDLSRWQQLAETVYSSCYHKLPFFDYSGQLDHPYKKYSFDHEEQNLVETYVLFPPLLNAYGLPHLLSQQSGQPQQGSSLYCINQLFYLLVQIELFGYPMDDLEVLTSYDNTEQEKRIYQFSLQSPEVYSCLCEVAGTVLAGLYSLFFNPSVYSDIDTQYYTTFWDKIKNVTFVRDGDFYDLTVPIYHHYEANGIIHHNSGKSTAGIIKDLERLRRGMSGILASPNLPHFKKSLWREFRNWCPKEVLVPAQRYRLSKEWQPHEAFELTFINGASLMCGGMENPRSWEGPNVSFAHLDEGRHATQVALTVLDGRIRIPGPNGEPPQGWITTTPKKNWLFEMFGPVTDKDPYADFKQAIRVVTLPVELNRENLADGYVENRRKSLTENEARILMDAEWEDQTDLEKFVNILWWDNCKEELPPLNRSEPGILSLDAAKGSESNVSDCFAVVLVTRHPHRPDDVAIRYCGIWQAQAGDYIDFEPIENEIRRLCAEYSIIEVCYDPYQLHDMGHRLRREGVAHTKEFNQSKDRLIADKQFQSLIMARRVAHDGNPLLRQHIDNADIKKHGEDGVRIIKRSASLKVDASVASSQGTARCLYYNI